MKFIGKNFQSWEEFSVDVNGLTVLTGPSMTGKSAIFRALRGIFYNDLSEAFIRYDSPGMELKVELDGHVITATRAPEESTKYEIDGKKFAKLGGRRPQELKDFGFNTIRIGDTELDPIFAPQFDAQFLIQGTSPSELNNILGGFASTEKLEYGKREANLRITQKNAEARTLAGEVHDAQTRQDAFEKLVILTTPFLTDVESLEPLIISLEGKLGVITQAIHHRDVLRPLKATLKKLSIPDLTWIETLAGQAKYTVMAFEAQDSWQHLAQTRDTIDQSTKFWQEVKRLYYGMEASQELSRLYAEINHQKRQGTTLSLILDSANLSVATDLIDSIKLVTTVDDLRRQLVYFRQSQAQLTTDLGTLQEEEHGLRHQLVANLVTCPECGAEFAQG
jgi:hypothetical protein